MFGVETITAFLARDIPERIKARRRIRAKRALNAQIVIGRIILAGVERGNPARNLNVEEAEIVAWGDETVRLVRKYAPDDVAHLYREAPFQLFGTQHEQKSRLVNFLRARLHNLGEIARDI